MKRLYRGVLIVVCIALWLGLRVAAADIAKTARLSAYREPLLFPDFLQDTDIYAWSLAQGETGAELLVQNIGDAVLTNIEITLQFYGEKLVFVVKQMAPGEKQRLYEISGRSYNGKDPVICTGVLAVSGDAPRTKSK